MKRNETGEFHQPFREFGMSMKTTSTANTKVALPRNRKTSNCMYFGIFENHEMQQLFVNDTATADVKSQTASE